MEKSKTFVTAQLIEDRIKKVINPNLLSEQELEDIIVRVEEDLILEKADEIRKQRSRIKGPSFNGVF